MNMHNFGIGTPALRPLVALTMDQLRDRAPSAFAETAHESRSARYAYIPTTRIIEALQDEGFRPVSAQQSISRCGRTAFTKHMLKFARMDGTELLRVGDSIPQVSLINSHDGTSAYNLIAGLYRLVCNNGLMVADSFAQSVKVQHTGDIVGRVIEGSFKVIDDATRAGEVSKAWGAIQLAPTEAAAFARAAAVLRWDDAEKGAPIATDALLRPRRHGDDGADLWRVFNRTQENLIQGGQRGRTTNARRMTVRPVAAIDGNVKLNRALWQLAEEMATLKAAA
jgi:hypothetical protein